MESETTEFDRDLQMLHELAARNRHAQVRQVLARLAAQEPDHHDVLYHSAQVDWLEDRDEAALATASRLAELYPQSYWGRLLLVKIQGSLGKLGEAEKVLLELIHEFPDDAVLYARYSVLMLETMHVAKAGELAARAIQLDPDDQEALTASVLHELVANPGEAANRRLAELVARYPDAVSTAMMVVAVLTEQGRSKEALLIAQEVLRQAPDSQGLVDTVIALKTASHWSMIPLRPFQKWGWGASIAVWFVMVILIRAAENAGYTAQFFPIVVVFLAFVVYSWVWPPILKRIMRG